MESWPTCSIESWESAFFSRRYGLNRAFSSSFAEIGVPRVLMCVSGNLVSRLKEVKPLVVSDGEQGIALGPMQGNRA